MGGITTISVSKTKAGLWHCFANITYRTLLKQIEEQKTIVWWGNKKKDTWGPDVVLLLVTLRQLADQLDVEYICLHKFLFVLLFLGLIPIFPMSSAVFASKSHAERAPPRGFCWMAGNPRCCGWWSAYFVSKWDKITHSPGYGLKLCCPSFD